MIRAGMIVGERTAAWGGLVNAVTGFDVAAVSWVENSEQFLSVAVLVDSPHGEIFKYVPFRGPVTPAKLADAFESLAKALRS